MLKHLRTNVIHDSETGCLLWAGRFSQNGYPVVTWHHKKLLVRRVLLTLTGRLRNDSYAVYSTCGDKRCVDEGHLRCAPPKLARSIGVKQVKLGGLEASIRSSKSKTKYAKMGRKEYDNVVRLRAKGMTYDEIAAVYGVHPSAVGYLLRTWARLTHLNGMNV